MWHGTVTQNERKRAKNVRQIVSQRVVVDRGIEREAEAGDFAACGT